MLLLLFGRNLLDVFLKPMASTHPRRGRALSRPDPGVKTKLDPYAVYIIPRRGWALPRPDLGVKTKLDPYAPSRVGVGPCPDPNRGIIGVKTKLDPYAIKPSKFSKSTYTYCGSHSCAVNPPLIGLFMM